MTGQIDPQDEFKRRRRSRNLALGLALAGMVLLFYLIALARIRGAAG